jgi:uncharacterized membrane protein YheB (UPF0754 family)
LEKGRDKMKKMVKEGEKYVENEKKDKLKENGDDNIENEVEELVNDDEAGMNMISRKLDIEEKKEREGKKKKGNLKTMI